MNKSDLIIIGKLVNSLVKKEIENSVTPLIKEIKTLNSNINKLLVENQERKPIVSNITPPSKQQPKTGLYSILSDIQPFDENTLDESYTDSILDTIETVNIQNDDPVSRVLNKLQNTDFKRTLEIMERASNNSGLVTNR